MGVTPKISHGINGLIYRTEARFLYETPERIGGGRYADLGTFCGRSATLLAGGMKEKNIEGMVVTVDTFDQCNVKNKYKLKDEDDYSVDTTYAYAMDRFIERGVNDRIWVLCMKTRRAAWLCYDLKFKFIFIDADHTYDGVNNDFETWAPLLEEGGELAFHDTDWPGVAKLMKELPDWGWEMTNHVFSLKTWKKAY